jgi:hypothetical protein
MKGGIFFRVAEIAEHRGDIHYFLLPPLLKKGDQRDSKEDESDHIDIELPFHRNEFGIDPVNQNDGDVGTHLSRYNPVKGLFDSWLTPGLCREG